MFSFFRKKPADETKEAAPPERPRSALGWLNADVGELLFGKKPVEAPLPTPPTATPSVPLPMPGPASTAPEAQPAPDPPRPVPAPLRPAPPLPAEPLAKLPLAPERRPADASPAEVPSLRRAEPAAVPLAPPAVPPIVDGEGPPGVQAERASWVAKLKSGLRRTGSTLAEAFVGAEISDALYEDLEAALLQADAGIAATRYLLDDLQARVKRADVRDGASARRLLARCIGDLLLPLERPLVIGEHAPTVIMVVGVNGAGKTTSVGKLARHLLDADQKVLLAAADTFRAAAREQLLAWAERAGGNDGAPASAGAAQGRIEIVSQQGGDPAGVTFDAVVAGKARGCDVVIADTAGRLATQAHLMEELKKIRRVIAKAEPGAPHEVLLVIDGNTGQNALTQVQAFDAALELTGLIITKLDGTAKGGVLAAIALWSRSRAQPLPVYFVGIGEKLADLQTFRAREFADALVG